MELAAKLDALKKCDLLAEADAEALRELAEAAHSEFFEVDYVLCTEGQLSSRVYVVASGSLEIRSGTGKLVSFAESGSLFGEYAMFVKGYRTAHVVAAESTLVLSFEDAWFRQFLLRCPAVTLQLLKRAVRRLHRKERGR